MILYTIINKLIIRKMRDFSREIERANKRIEKKTTQKNVFRIEALHVNCSYYNDRFYFEGKKMMLSDGNSLKSDLSWYRFVYDEDRERINKAKEWSDKKEYLLYKPKIKK